MKTVRDSYKGHRIEIKTVKFAYINGELVGHAEVTDREALRQVKERIDHPERYSKVRR